MQIQQWELPESSGVTRSLSDLFIHLRSHVVRQELPSGHRHDDTSFAKGVAAHNDIASANLSKDILSHVSQRADLPSTIIGHNVHSSSSLLEPGFGSSMLMATGHVLNQDREEDPFFQKLSRYSSLIGELEVDTEDKCFRFDSQIRGDVIWAVALRALDTVQLLHQIVTNLGLIMKFAQQANNLHEAFEGVSNVGSQLMQSLQQRVVLYIQSKFQFIDGIPYHQDQVELLMFIDEPQIAEMKYWLHIVDQVSLSIFLSVIIIWL